ncbi:hypothetical protein AB6A40_008614 [Gnathostoma spinigerum]|uniref:Methyltransferase type 11 domain-containing protein n=1 Tax=Gnathostoma spinigerum TaxID=75299 RepID=A0ABD6EPK6_9BILA
MLLRVSCSTHYGHVLFRLLPCSCPTAVLSNSVSRAYVTSSDQSASSVDAGEVDRFNKLSGEWLGEDNAFKALHSLNRLRIPWIVENLRKSKTPITPDLGAVRIVDVGCGGGLVAVPLARLGAEIYGIDASADGVSSAKLSVEKAFKYSDTKPKTHFSFTSVERFAEQHIEEFDAVVASEVVEHVLSLNDFVSSCVRLLRKDGLLFFTTINRTLLSRIVAIWLAEVRIFYAT